MQKLIQLSADLTHVQDANLVIIAPIDDQASANGVSASSSLAQLRHRCCNRHVSIAIFWQLMALPKCTSISIKLASAFLDVQSTKQFAVWDNGYLQYKKDDFKHCNDPSIYIAVFLATHVFDCDLTGVPCEEAVCKCDHCWKFVFHCANGQKCLDICHWNWKQLSPTWF